VLLGFHVSFGELAPDDVLKRLPRNSFGALHILTVLLSLLDAYMNICIKSDFGENTVGSGHIRRFRTSGIWSRASRVAILSRYRLRLWTAHMQGFNGIIIIVWGDYSQRQDISY
jgi:hypothetical protein